MGKKEERSMERLYNGIKLPEEWPPRQQESTLDKPLEVPYLKKKPECIDISVGRQLFVDDFLIKETDLSREFLKPERKEHPILWPETDLELNGGYCTCACPFNGGVFYDRADRTYKMWYHAGWFDGTAYAESEDGDSWRRLHQLEAGRESDRVLPRRAGFMRDGDAVWLDEEAEDPGERYKMLTFYRCFDRDYRYYHLKPKHAHDDPASVAPKEITVLYRSPDGIHWTETGQTGPCGDNTTFFYNPFRKKWVYSLRTFSQLDSRVRVRGYWEADDFFKGSQWKEEDIRFWSRTDIFDRPDPELGYYTQLYNLDAVAYESIMLGVYSVFMGPPNFVCEKTGMPKINDLKLGFSRDGFHFSRGDYEPFLESSREKGRWDYGYLHPANGICTVSGDWISFYYTAFSGMSPKFGTHKYSGGAVGAARLRRDGFACMKDQGDGGYLLTELVQYQGRYLFVNGESSDGYLQVELLDEAGKVLPGYGREDCIPLQGDSTRYQIRWKDHDTLEQLPERIRVRFFLKRARLYAFWITDSPEGRSHGYLGAGSPEAGKSRRDEDPA